MLFCLGLRFMPSNDNVKPMNVFQNNGRVIHQAFLAVEVAHELVEAPADQPQAVRGDAQVGLGIQELGGHGIIQDGVGVDLDTVSAVVGMLRKPVVHDEPVEDEGVEVVHLVVRRGHDLGFGAAVGVMQSGECEVDRLLLRVHHREAR